MFKLLRFYGIAGLIGILVTLSLLGTLYRQVAIRGTVELAERGNRSLAQTAVNAIRPDLVEYLLLVSELDANEKGPRTLPPRVAEAIGDLMEDVSVIRVKLYNRKGVVVFSTLTAQIGADQSRNAGVATALEGLVADAFVYRDNFNAFDRQTEEDNLLQTYIPVRASHAEPVLGVFEIYTDMNPLVQRNERALFTLLAGAALILGTLYVLQLMLVRWAGDLIEAQQQTIRERTLTLELLSSQMLKNEESQRKKIAADLHEGLAQTLSAIKVTVEDARQRLAAHQKLNSGALEAIVPALQSAIQEVRTIATELRPSSLDDLGLVATIRWYSREFQESHPGMHIEPELLLQEAAVPAPLKIVIYRVMESAMNTISRDVPECRVRIALRTVDKAIGLTIDEMPVVAGAAQEADPSSRFGEAAERVSLSGGEFAAERNNAGGATLRAVWEL